MMNDELKNCLSAALKDVKDNRIRRKIIARLKEYLCHLERLQRMPYEHRAVFWKCNYHLFDYLRANGQIQREAGNFDDEIKEVLNSL